MSAPGKKEDGPHDLNQLQSVIHPDNLALANALLKAAAAQNAQQTNNLNNLPTLLPKNVQSNPPKSNFNSISSLANLSESTSNHDSPPDFLSGQSGSGPLGQEKEEEENIDVDQNPYAGLPTLRLGWFLWLPSKDFSGMKRSRIWQTN